MIQVSPRVSVIVCVYNCERYLAEALDSVFAQTFRDFELIVVDDGSTDRTPEIVASYGARLRAIHQRNGGVSAARNAGLRAARGEWIAFLDADDIWLPVKLERQLAAAAEHPEAGIIVADMLQFVGERVLVPSRNRAMRARSGMVLLDVLSRNWICPSAALVRRACYADAGEFIEGKNWGEDWLMWLRIASKHAVLSMEEILVRYRVHDSNASLRTPAVQFETIMENYDLALEMIPQLAAQRAKVRAVQYRVAIRRAIDDITAVDPYAARQKLRWARRARPCAPAARLLSIVAWTPVPVLRFCKYCWGK
jgi:glycosyltransferase involved in cell wall biosynthesis